MIEQIFDPQSIVDDEVDCTSDDAIRSLHLAEPTTEDNQVNTQDTLPEETLPEETQLKKPDTVIATDSIPEQDNLIEDQITGSIDIPTLQRTKNVPIVDTDAIPKRTMRRRLALQTIITGAIVSLIGGSAAVAKTNLDKTTTEQALASLEKSFETRLQQAYTQGVNDGRIDERKTILTSIGTVDTTKGDQTISLLQRLYTAFIEPIKPLYVQQAINSIAVVSEVSSPYVSQEVKSSVDSVQLMLGLWLENANSVPMLDKISPTIVQDATTYVKTIDALVEQIKKQ